MEQEKGVDQESAEGAELLCRVKPVFGTFSPPKSIKWF